MRRKNSIALIPLHFSTAVPSHHGAPSIHVSSGWAGRSRWNSQNGLLDMIESGAGSFGNPQVSIVPVPVSSLDRSRPEGTTGQNNTDDFLIRDYIGSAVR